MNIIIYPPTIDWGFMKQRPQQLMQQFADHGYTVFYCNKTSSEEDIQELAPNLFLVSNHEKFVTKTLPQLRADSTCNVGVWCSWSKLAKELIQYKADWIIYDCVDEFAEWMKYEKEMVQIASAVTCTAERIYNRLKREYPNKNIELIRNAYDKNMGLHLHPSSPHPSIKKKIGYIGAWAPWVDDSLVRRLASKLIDHEIVIIGAEFGKNFTLKHLPNVTFLGQIPHEQLASHLSQMDVCIIPFKITPVTLATNPVKMYEYLATGKPVISSALPECVLAQPYVDIGKNHQEFISKVSYRLSNPGNENERKSYSLSNTWENRVNQAITLINNISH
ncbi:glycosyltransferase [Sutcliffiella rhizosphaerae]|uniref:Glycosyltransferase n=1 Tax=Sutcliffiella rhizosphaerae TaxID=2880967 RepID=A0ABM8YSQ6_9BACI|nr:glycosyltransferase [Sutcliffiella rhizosphaerae]CAG9622820.1 hypothetical protein BACCIP111883_03611 [Sutcliffiella rhizosphaerae]